MLHSIGIVSLRLVHGFGLEEVLKKDVTSIPVEEIGSKDSGRKKSCLNVVLGILGNHLFR